MNIRLKDQKINIKNFTGDAPSLNLKIAVDWLNNNKERVIQKSINFNKRFGYSIDEIRFEFPGYLWMPKKISYRLFPEEVGWLNSEIYYWFQDLEIK